MLGTVGNKNDSDLVASNIKNGVEIFGVDGSLSQAPTVGGTLGGFIIDETLRLLNTQTNGINFGVCSTEYNSNPVSVTFAMGLSQILCRCLRYNISLDTIERIGYIGISDDDTFVSAYLEGNIIHLNYIETNQSNEPRHIDFDISTNSDTLNTVIIGHNTTGTLLNAKVDVDGILYQGAIISGDNDDNSGYFGFKTT